MLSPLQIGVLERPLAPEASLGACDTLAGLRGEACPDALLCISSCALHLEAGDKWSSSAFSGVRAVLLTSTESTLQ